MNDEKIALIRLIAQMGFDSAVIIWRAIASNPTIEDGIKKLQDDRGKTWDMYKASEQP